VLDIALDVFEHLEVPQYSADGTNEDTHNADNEESRHFSTVDGAIDDSV